MLVAGLVVACGARTDLGGNRDASSSPPVTELQGAVVNDCAPNDGPAITIPLAPSTAAVVPTCANWVVSDVIVRFSFWGPNMPKAAGTFPLGDGSFASGSYVAYCPSQGQCAQVVGGTLTLTEYGPTSATGFFTLQMPDSSTLTGNFTAIPICHNSPQCG
jgi:hypothetical protein